MYVLCGHIWFHHVPLHFVGLTAFILQYSDCEIYEIGVREADEDAVDCTLSLLNGVMEACTMDM